MHEESRQSGARATNSFNTFEKRFNHSILKLTGIYVIILAAILFVSSSVLYSVFSTRLEHRFRGPFDADDVVIVPTSSTTAHMYTYPNNFPTPDDVRSDLINLLVLVNGFLLLIAGGLSYKLAEWTLSPLKKMYDNEKRFLGDASHELRTPLSILKTELENELSEMKNTASASRVKSNLEEVDRMSKIISDLLALSRLSDAEAKSKFTRNDINLNELIQKTNERLAVLAKANDINLVCHLPNDAVIFNANEALVEAILLNCIKNAIAYNTPHGSVTTTLTVDDKAIHISVADTGIGMSNDDVAKVFERFYRVDKSRSRQTGGSGLGLSIVQAAIDSLGGSIEATSELGKGTTLTISLPL